MPHARLHRAMGGTHSQQPCPLGMATMRPTKYYLFYYSPPATRSPHLCGVDAALRMSHVAPEVVQDAAGHACVARVPRDPERVQVRLRKLPVVVQHLGRQQAHTRVSGCVMQGPGQGLSPCPPRLAASAWKVTSAWGSMGPRPRFNKCSAAPLAQGDPQQASSAGQHTAGQHLTHK